MTLDGVLLVAVLSLENNAKIVGAGVIISESLAQSRPSRLKAMPRSRRMAGYLDYRDAGSVRYPETRMSVQ